MWFGFLVLAVVVCVLSFSYVESRDWAVPLFFYFGLVCTLFGGCILLHCIILS